MLVVSVAAVPWLTACWVLVLAGLAKLRRPLPTMGAMRALRLPGSRPLVYALAIGEVAVGVAGTVVGSVPVAVCVAALYASFGVFVVASLRRGGMLQTCGCFGSPDIPATPTHLVVDVGLAIAAVGAALGHGGPAHATAVADAGADGLAVVALAAVATILVVAMLTALPLLQRRRLVLREAFGW